jgi:dGTPase
LRLLKPEKKLNKLFSKKSKKAAHWVAFFNGRNYRVRLIDSLDYNTTMNSEQPINFKHKLNVNRPYEHKHVPISVTQIKDALESDRGRIINSASVRRLQQKTQVFPLERNAAVRSRLTHSLEVQQNGRYLIKSIFKKLSNNQIQNLGLTGLESATESLVEMACLMHDIGNPPFGHFGEVAISSWFQQHLHSFDMFSNADNIELAKQMLQDLQNFEGNAQAIRLTFSLQQMNLTYAQTASVLKYTRGAFEKISPNKPSYLQKKPGYYLSERSFVTAMLEQLNIEPGHRHPLTYVMEAADDMAYCMADLEDAVEKGILNLDELSRLLKNKFIELGGDFDSMDILGYQGELISFNQIISDALAASQRDTINNNHEFFIKLRINLIHHLVNHASQRFIDHIRSIYHGSFNQALLEDESVANRIVQTFKQVGYGHVFNHQEVQDLELQGHRIITGLLNFYLPLLHLSNIEFNQLINGDEKGMSYLTLLLNRVDIKTRKAYLQSITHTKSDVELWMFYYRCRLIQDHVSAMTDHSALDEFKLLSVAD